MAEKNSFEDIDSIKFKLEHILLPSIMKEYFRSGLDEYSKNKVKKIIMDLSKLDAYRINLDKLFNTVLGTRNDKISHHPELIVLLHDVNEKSSLQGINQYLLQTESYKHLEASVNELERFYTQQLSALEQFNKTGDRRLLHNFNMDNYNLYTQDVENVFQDIRRSFLQYHNFAISNFRKQDHTKVSVMSYKISKAKERFKLNIKKTIEKIHNDIAQRRKELYEEKKTGRLPEVRSEIQYELDRNNDNQPTLEEKLERLTHESENLSRNHAKYWEFLKTRTNGEPELFDELVVTRLILNTQKTLRKRLDHPNGESFKEIINNSNRNSKNPRIRLLFKKPEELTKEEIDILEQMSKIYEIQRTLSRRYDGLVPDFFKNKELLKKKPWEFSKEDIRKLKDIYFTYYGKIARTVPNLRTSVSEEDIDAPFGDNSTPNRKSSFFKKPAETKSKTRSTSDLQDLRMTKKLSTGEIRKAEQNIDTDESKTTRMKRVHDKSDSMEDR